jgi:hypothetical protein
VRVARGLFALATAACLVAGVAGGLLRAGVRLPGAAQADWIGPAVTAHAFLMICCFLGTVIGIERAVAVKKRWALAAPLLSGLAGLAMLSGSPNAARWIAVGSGLAFVAVNVLVVMRQRAAHTSLLLVAALAWMAGNLLFAAEAPSVAVIPWWFSFLVLTIAAERLEMTRLMRRRAAAAASLHAVLGAMLLGAAVSAPSATAGGVLFGLSLVGLALWLIVFDIARRTVLAHGLSRYMAVCLLLGYLWLGVAGAAWVASALGLSCRDAALHGLALGFVFSMMLGHAPVILPAIARVKLLFNGFFYVPLALLHATLAVRIVLGHADAVMRAAGAVGNAMAIAMFAATVVGSVVAWRVRHPIGARAAGPAPDRAGGP